MTNLKTTILLAVLTLVLTACGAAGVGGGGRTPTPAPAAQALTMPLTGELTGYEGPRRVINVRATESGYSHNVGWLEEDGTFSINLPEPSASELTRFGDSDKFNGTFVNSNVRFVEISGTRTGDIGGIRVIGGGRMLLNNTGGTYLSGPAGSLYASLLYVDQATTIRHSIPGGMNIDVKLAAGWNILANEVWHNQHGTMMFDMRNATLDEIEWHYSN